MQPHSKEWRDQVADAVRSVMVITGGGKVLGLDEDGKPIDITGQRRVAVPNVRVVADGRQLSREQMRRVRQRKPDGEATP